MTYGRAKQLEKDGHGWPEIARRLELPLATVAGWLRPPVQVKGDRPPWWMKRPPGERFPLPPGRTCADCGVALNRYHDSDKCYQHEQRTSDEEVAA